MGTLSGIIFNPLIFLGFCALIIVSALVVAFFYIYNSDKEEKSNEKERNAEKETKEKEIVNHINKNAELSALVDSLKSQIAIQAREVQEIDRLREELQRKETAYRGEALAKEKYSGELKAAQAKLIALQDEIVILKNSKPDVKEEDFGALNQLKAELVKKDELLRNETLTKEKFWAELKVTESQILSIQNELKTSQEVYQGLKEQYAELERQVDALNQQVALEKSLYIQLKEERASQ